MSDVPSLDAGLRPASIVMSARRARAVVPTVLSFPRQAMRELVRERWQIAKDRFALDANGCGEILYRVHGSGRTFHFFLLSNALPEEQKTDRNFAAGWDAMGVLCEGEWTAEREMHLRREIPKQRAGFADYDTLVYARGNRSGRVFEAVVASLADGRQPDPALIAPIGYILRTTAFIGNGQLGTRPFAGLPPDHPLRRPYHVQFASAFVLREFVFDLVEHMARARNPRAARLAPAFRRYIGIGNSAATGLSAFVANHPHFMHCWSLANERALAHVGRLPMHGADAATFERVLDKAIRYFAEGAREHDGVFTTPQALAGELTALRTAYARMKGSHARWQALVEWAANAVSDDAREVLHAVLLELDPALPSQFAEAFLADERLVLAPAATLAQLRALLERNYGWALADRSEDATRYFWYRSTSAPRDVRRGFRGRLSPHEVETNMDTVHQARSLAAALAAAPADATVADLVHARPDLRHFVARAQSLADCPYGELRDPWLAADFAPFGSVRFALAFFGMEKFEAAFPKSVRGTFMQGAPIAEDVAAGRDGDWPFPLMPSSDTAGDAGTLAPLPTVTPFTPPASASDDRRERRIAPNELARMVYTALQGHGAALGVAEDAADLAVFAEREGGRGIATVVRHCGEGLAAAVTDDGGAAVRAMPTHAALRGHGRSSLLLAPIAFDLACAAALRHGCGVVAVHEVRDAWLMAGLPLRAALHDCVALVAWRSGVANDAIAFAVAGHESPSAWLARGDAESVAGLATQLRDAAHGVPAALPLASLARALADATVADGFIVAVAPAARDGGVTLREAVAAHMRCDHIRTGEDTARRERMAYRDGIAVARDDFDALAAAGRALLLPQEQEHRVLPPGTDPLKTF